MKRLFAREFGEDPDSEGFIDISDYIYNPPEGSEISARKIEEFLKGHIGRCFDLSRKNYDVVDRNGEHVGMIVVNDSIASVVYGGRIVAGVYQQEVFNQFSDAVSSKEFLKDPEGYHKRLQSAFSVITGDSFNGEEVYWGLCEGFLEEDVLLDVVSDRIVMVE